MRARSSIRRLPGSFVVGSLTAVLSLSTSFAGPTSAQQTAVAPPVARVIPHQLEMHGHVRTDDYYWLRDRENPDVIYSGDGPNCVRRKQFHARIRDEYNPILQGVLAEYRDGNQLPNATFVNVFDVRFDSTHVNGGDCFHPSEAGHALLAEKQYCRSQWSNGDPLCTQ